MHAAGGGGGEADREDRVHAAICTRNAIRKKHSFCLQENYNSVTTSWGEKKSHTEFHLGILSSISPETICQGKREGGGGGGVSVINPNESWYHGSVQGVFTIARRSLECKACPCHCQGLLPVEGVVQDRRVVPRAQGTCRAAISPHPMEQDAAHGHRHAGMLSRSSAGIAAHAWAATSQVPREQFNRYLQAKD